MNRNFVRSGNANNGSYVLERPGFVVRSVNTDHVDGLVCQEARESIEVVVAKSVDGDGDELPVMGYFFKHAGPLSL
jgi:hypothetical protein